MIEPAPSPAQARPGRAGERGYTMVAFVMIIAVMSIMMGVAVQAVSFQMRREREAELIFRGEQYVEAIRLFKMKYGRNPMRLKELWDAKPRVIRKKWKDPMTDSPMWGLVFEGDQIPGRGGMPVGPGGVDTKPTGTPGFGDHRDDRDRPPVVRDGRKPADGEGDLGPLPMGTPQIPVSGDGESVEPTRVGPIVGVQTTACGESIKVYEGRSDYCEWKFIFRDRPAVGPGGGRGRPPGGPRRTPGTGPQRSPGTRPLITPTATR